MPLKEKKQTMEILHLAAQMGLRPSFLASHLDLHKSTLSRAANPADTTVLSKWRLTKVSAIMRKTMASNVRVLQTQPRVKGIDTSADIAKAREILRSDLLKDAQSLFELAERQRMEEE